MSLADIKHLEGLGDIRGAMYDFNKAGDILPKHNHTADNVHIMIVARGKVKSYSHDWEQESVAGQIVDFRAGEPHEIVALEDNTRIVNINKKYAPWGVAQILEDSRTESSPPNVKLVAVSNVFSRMMHFAKKGDIEQGHLHPYDHATLVSSGAVRVEIKSPESGSLESKDFYAPTMIFIRKDLKHKLTALEDNTVCACIHALRTVDESLIDPDFLVTATPIIGDGKFAEKVVDTYGQPLKSMALA